MSRLDPDLPGLWIVPGEAATYEVRPDGAYLVGEPERPVAFARDGRIMAWGNHSLERLHGAGDRPEGRWRDRKSGEEWTFYREGDYQVKAGDGALVGKGLWALRDDGASLWTCEWRGRLSANGAEVTFHLPDGPPVSYAYTVKDGIWTLLDRTSWQKLAEYRRP